MYLNDYEAALFMEEIELKFLNIDPNEIRLRLQKCGAHLVFNSEITSTSFHGTTLKKGAFLRMRTIGDRTYLAYKGPCVRSAYKRREEIEVMVENSEAMMALLTSLGFSSKPSHQKRREHYRLGNGVIDIDFIEGVPPFIEVESNSEEDLALICKQLSLNPADGSSKTIYELYPQLKRKKQK